MKKIIYIYFVDEEYTLYICTVVQMHNNTNVHILNLIKQHMSTIKVEHKMPDLLPHGWKQEVATLLGVHRNTINNNLKEGKGEMYDRIMKCVKEKYGKVVKTESV